MSSTVLNRIATDVEKRLQERRQGRDPHELKERALKSRVPSSLKQALRAPGPHIIAEVKLRSPSEGAIAPSLVPQEVAEGYVASGASAISVLTEQDHFGGELSYLAAIRERCPDACLLMKDFVIDEEQLYEARLYGADAVLLIVALLGEQRTQELMRAARELGLSTLVEVHNEEEMAAAVRLEADVIGVNNRDLKTLQVSLDVSRRLSKGAPEEVVLVAESGLKTASDILNLQSHGYSAFLIGTSFMRTQEPARALAEMRKSLL